MCYYLFVDICNFASHHCIASLIRKVSWDLPKGMRNYIVVHGVGSGSGVDRINDDFNVAQEDHCAIDFGQNRF